MQSIDNVQFILASASPRRLHLLRQAGFCFEVVPSCVDEEAFETEQIDSGTLCRRLALAKAREVADRFPKMFVLGADTVVDYDGHIIGKPNDAAHAEAITRKLFSKPHKVITGVALICSTQKIEISEVDITTVYPRQLTESQIADHIAGGNWQGKAGAYGIQETGDEFVERIEGSFSNVMGLPMERVTTLFEKFGILPNIYDNYYLK